MRGAAELKAFMAEHKVGGHDLKKSRYPEHTALRQKAIQHLQACGYGPREISRVMGCSKQMVRYWTVPEFRTDRMHKHGRRNSAARKFHALGLALEELYG